MSIRIAAGFEPMEPPLRLHGCHRVGNVHTGLDPNSVKAKVRMFVIEPLPICEEVGAMREMVDELEGELCAAFLIPIKLGDDGR